MTQVCENAANVQMLKERFAEKADNGDQVHELRRRYVLNETGQTKRNSSEDFIGNNGWEYEVVRGRWKVSASEEKKRKAVMTKTCNKKALKNVMNNITKKRHANTDNGIEEAIEELRKLQTTDPQEPLMANERKRQGNPQQIYERWKERNKQIELKKLWMEFVLTERIKHEWNERMPNGIKEKCACGKAAISYPHWPPTNKEEAWRQFEYCMREDNTHRKNLVIRWWEHFNGLAHMTPWTVSERQGRYREAAELIKEHSTMVQKETEKSYTHRKRPKGWRCYEYCDKVIENKEVSCLCHCRQHQDQCPIHSY